MVAHVLNEFFLRSRVTEGILSDLKQVALPFCMARILCLDLRDTQSVLTAELIGILLCLQHFVAALVKHLAVLVVDAVHNQVIMDGVGVHMSRDNDLKAGKVVGKFQSDLVSGLGS